uniref:Prostaglandin E synthase 3 n=1 Tax=Sinocyclocheilus grahami TaxID=75366 RepID=A0A672K6P0_SINGR
MQYSTIVVNSQLKFFLFLIIYFCFSCVGGTDNIKHHNEVELFESIDPNGSKHKRTDRSVFCCLKKAEPGKSWPRLTKEKAKVRDWEDDSDEELSSFDRFSEVCLY